jgi:hypothetical protein
MIGCSPWLALRLGRQQIAYCTHDVAEPAFKRMLIEAGIEPILNPSLENSGSPCSRYCVWAPVVVPLKID